MSRGGVGAWYQGVAERYVEIWDEIDPAEFAKRNAARGVVKHYEPGDMDRDILDRVARRIGTTDFDVLHRPDVPGCSHWSGQRAMGFVDAHLRFTTMTPALMIRRCCRRSRGGEVLCGGVAARYAGDSRPPPRDGALSERLPVVLLDTGLVLEDDHADYTFATRGRVMSARAWMTPRNNLGVQTQIVAGAKAFVGTCGSIAGWRRGWASIRPGLFVDPKWCMRTSRWRCVRITVWGPGVLRWPICAPSIRSARSAVTVPSADHV